MALTGPLRFPKTVGTNEVPNFIVFRPMKAKFGTYDSLKDIQNEHGSSFAAKTPADYNVSQFTSAGGLKGLLNQVTGVGGIVDSIANGALSSLKSIAGGALNITGDISMFGGAINAKLNIGDMIGGLLGAGQKTQTQVISGTSINLFMPAELEMSLNADYSTQNVRATTIAAVESVDIVNGMSADAFGKSITEIIKKAGSAVATEFATGGQIGAATQIATGRVGNNYTFRLFNNMQHRSFSYSFRLIARNAKDTEVIKGICDNFMEYMLPIKSSELYFYDVPYMWDIKYMHLGSENEFIDQPNMCFLENVGIKYGTDSAGHAYTNGAPIDVTLTLQFTEVEPMRGARKAKTTAAQKGLNIARNNPSDNTYGD